MVAAAAAAVGKSLGNFVVVRAATLTCQSQSRTIEGGFKVVSEVQLFVRIDVFMQPRTRRNTQVKGQKLHLFALSHAHFFGFAESALNVRTSMRGGIWNWLVGYTGAFMVECWISSNHCNRLGELDSLSFL